MAGTNPYALEANISEKKAWNGGKSPFGIEYGKVMMWYFLVSDAFTFSAFLITYGMLRASSLSWPKAEDVFASAPLLTGKHPLVFVTFMSFLLIVSSVTMVRAVQESWKRNKSGVAFWVLMTILGGAGFLSCQAWEWSHLFAEGFGFSNNPILNGHQVPNSFSHLFFFITGFHGFHVFSGVVILAILLANTLNGKYDRPGRDYLMVEKIGLYWHFVDLVWVFVFLVFYLL
jgi:cytochrome c oxidase subunit 3